MVGTCGANEKPIFEVIKRQDCWNRCVPVFWCEAELRSFWANRKGARCHELIMSSHVRQVFVEATGQHTDLTDLTDRMQCEFQIPPFLSHFILMKWCCQCHEKHGPSLLGWHSHRSSSSFLETLQVHHQLSCLLIHSAALQAGGLQGSEGRTSRLVAAKVHGSISWEKPKSGHAHWKERKFTKPMWRFLFWRHEYLVCSLLPPKAANLQNGSPWIVRASLSARSVWWEW